MIDRNECMVMWSYGNVVRGCEVKCFRAWTKRGARRKAVKLWQEDQPRHPGKAEDEITLYLNGERTEL